MTDKLFVQIILLGVAIGEWVEITKVANKNATKLEVPKIITSTSPSYEVILVRPQHVYEISATTPVQRNASENLESRSSSTAFAVIDITSTDGVLEETKIFYEDGNTTKKENLIFKETPIMSISSNLSKNAEYPKLVKMNNNQSFSDGDDYVDEIDDGPKENDSSHFYSVLNHAQKNLLNYKEKSLKGKIALLKDLRDNLLYEIKTRMSKLWLPSTENSESRGYKDYYPDDYHIDFPSNEGALMTIGFLTFAVFLIKLVLKLIYTLKYKQQYNFQTTTTAASVFLKRSEREIAQEELSEQSARIMRYIEEYPLS